MDNHAPPALTYCLDCHSNCRATNLEGEKMKFGDLAGLAMICAAFVILWSVTP
jgi:hypothetical protein